MSVYRPKGTDRYVYDFQRRGKRYLGPCETVSLSEARRVERAKIAEVEAGFGPDDTSDLTIDAAAARWFDEVGKTLKSAADLERSLDLVVMCFGARDPESFGPEMATELLFFLSKVLENTIRAWLDLPE